MSAPPLPNHCRDARVYDHITTVMHEMSTPVPAEKNICRRPNRPEGSTIQHAMIKERWSEVIAGGKRAILSGK